MPQACASASMIITPGITGRCGKCPGKNGSLKVTFLSAWTYCPGLAIEHAIHQQKRIPVRQLPHDRFDIESAGFRHHRSFSPNRRKCATIRRHARVGTVGMPLE